jgi:hypothetical protein
MTPVNDPHLINQLENAQQPVTDPALISQLEGNAQQSTGNPLLRLAGDIAAGGDKFDTGIVNSPHNLMNLLSPTLASKIPQVQDSSSFYSPQNPGFLDKLAQGAAQFAPYLPIGAEKIAQGGIGSALTGLLQQGAAYGATQSNNPLIGALTGALTNATLGLAGKGVSPILDAGKSYLSRFAAQGITKNIGNFLSSSKDVNNAQAFSMAKQNFENYGDKETQAWNNLKQQARVVDNTPRFTGYAAPETPEAAGAANASPVASSGTPLSRTLPSNLNTYVPPPALPAPAGTNMMVTNPADSALVANTSAPTANEKIIYSTRQPAFDNSSYVNALSNQLSKISGQSSRQSGFARANQDSQQLLGDYINDQHGTFTDAIEHNQALNKDYQNELTPGKSLPFNTVNFAKSNLQKAIQANIENNNLQDTLGSAWNNANQITSQKNQIFNQLSGNKGNTLRSTFSGVVNGKDPNADATTFVKDYLPTAKGDGIQKMQQFSQMLGDEGTAKNVLKQNYFDKAVQGNSVAPRTFLSKYNNLSDEQQGYLFSPEENQTIQALNKISESHPDVFSNSMMSSFGHHGIAATLGGILGLSTGHGLWEGLGAGILGGVAANAGMRKLFENPAISNYFVNALTKTAPVQSSLLPSLSSVLSRSVNPLARSTLVPQAVNFAGGQ